MTTTREMLAAHKNMQPAESAEHALKMTEAVRLAEAAHCLRQARRYSVFAGTSFFIV